MVEKQKRIGQDKISMIGIGIIYALLLVAMMIR
jgi:hypothetical protein